MAPIIAGRVLAGLILALTIPFAVCAQEGVVVSYDGYAGFQGPLWAAKDLELFRKHGLKAEFTSGQVVSILGPGTDKVTH